MSVFADITQPGVAPLVGAAITAVVSINTLFLKWLLKSFEGLRTNITDLAKTHQLQIDDHEEKDQVRHEDNLRRFETIAVALARIDATNLERSHKT